jgi:hypothetical protein
LRLTLEDYNGKTTDGNMRKHRDLPAELLAFSTQQREQLLITASTKALHIGARHFDDDSDQVSGISTP